MGKKSIGTFSLSLPSLFSHRFHCSFGRVAKFPFFYRLLPTTHAPPAVRLVAWPLRFVSKSRALVISHSESSLL